MHTLYVAILAAALVATQTTAEAALRTQGANHAGMLDPSFGNAGRVTIASGLTPSVALVQPDERTVVAGPSGVDQASVVRVLPTGALDSTFGSGGSVTLSLFSLTSLARQSDGKLLVAGAATDGHNAELVRLNSDGSLDDSFGTDGVLRFAFVQNSSNVALVTLEQSDGLILAAGFGIAVDSDVYLTSLARFHPDGSADPTFGSGGIVALDLVGGATAFGLQADGKILVCGGFVTSAEQLVVRFTRSGQLDGTYRGGGLIAAAHTGGQPLGQNAFQLDGKLVQWATMQDRFGTKRDVQVKRSLRDMHPDPQFHRPLFHFGAPQSPESAPEDVELQNDGKLLVGGFTVDRSGNGIFGLARLDPGGTFDAGFGQQGRVVTGFANPAAMLTLALQPDGNIIAAGRETVGSAGSLVLARYFGN